LGELVQETLALTRRLFIQLQRPSTLIAGMSACYVAGFVWALFQNAPQGLFGSQSYGQFLGAGVIVLLPLRSAQCWLPVMFDRIWL